MINKLLLFIVVFIGTGLTSWGQESSYSLEEAKAYAVNNHALAKNADLDIQYAEKQVKETAAIGLPQISGEVKLQYFFDIPSQVVPSDAFGFPDEINAVIGRAATEFNMPLPDNTTASDWSSLQFGTDQSISAGVTVTQLVFNGTYMVGLKAAKTYKELSLKNKEATDVELKHNVEKAYYMVLVADENLSILKKNADNLSQLQKETEALYEAGFTEEIDADRVKLAMANLNSQLETISKQAAMARMLLNFQMGLPLDQTISLEDSLQGLTSDVVKLDASSFDPNNRVEFQSMLVNEQLADLDLNRYKSNRYPSLAAFFTYSQNGFMNNLKFVDAGQNWFPTTIGGLTLKIPIFGLQNGALIQQAKINKQRVENQKSILSNSLQLEAEQSNVSYSSSYNNYMTHQESLTLAEKIYKTAQIKFNEGVGSSVELSNARTDLYTTQANYINSLYDLLNSKAELNKSLGQ